jgi:hypothetical protein
MLRSAILTAVSLFVIGASPTMARSVTIGISDSGNCSLGGCLSGDFVYEQLYSSSAFSGELNFHQISFFAKPDPETQLPFLVPPSTNGVFESGYFDISFATATEPLGSDFPIGSLENIRSFFSGPLGGPFTNGVYTIIGSVYNYNPSKGNLVLIMNCHGCSGNESHLNNYASAVYDLGPPLVSRAYYQVGEGMNHDLTGLVTEFSTGVAPAVPEPSTWAMMLLGFAGLGFLAHRRGRETKLA